MAVQWDMKEMPQRWPHFMRKNNRKCYGSKNVLGSIYDRVVQQPVRFSPEWHHTFDQRILARFDHHDELLESARYVKEQYDTAVRRVLAQNNLETEFELWTGFSMSKPALGSDYKRQEDLGREYESLKQRFRLLCYQAAGGTAEEKLDPFVATMYRVTEIAHSSEPGDPTGESQFKRSISFPWIFPQVLIRIALGAKYNARNMTRRHLGLELRSKTQKSTRP